MNESDDIQLKSSVASFLNKLPSDEFKDLDLTLSQIIRWDHLRKKSSLQASYWYSLLNLENNPLNALEEEGFINQWEHLAITLYVDFYQRLWELIQSSESSISKSCEQQKIPYPFASYGNRSSAYFLMEILKGFIDGEFQNCLEPYHKFSVKDINKLATYLLRTAEPTSSKKQEVMAIGKAKNCSGNNDWFHLLLHLCDKESKQNPIIKMRFDAVMGSIKKIAEYQKTTTERTRSSSKFNKPKSYEWRNGEYFAASSVGGTYTS